MSFTQLFDKFDLVSQHLKQGLKALSVLSSFFKTYRRTLEAFGQSLDRSITVLLQDLPMESGVDTLSTALGAIAVSMRRVAETVSGAGGSMQMEVIEPLELFFEHFTSTNESLIGTGLQAFNSVLKAKDSLSKSRERYCESCEIRQKADQQVILSPSDKLEKAKKTYEQACVSAKSASDRYLHSISDYNSLLMDYEKRIPSVLESLQQSEESRIHFLKYTLEKFVRTIQRMDIGVADTAADMAVIVGNISSPIDIRVFVDGQKGTIPTLLREDFIQYEEIGTEDQPQQRTVGKAVERIFPSVLSGNHIEFTADSDELMLLIDSIKSSDGRCEFLSALEARKYSPDALSPQSLIQLADLFTVMLTEIQMSNDRDEGTFYRLITLTTNFYGDVEGRKRYLSSLLGQHRIWSDASRWIATIEWTIATRIAIEKQMLLRQKRRHRGSGIFNTLKSLAGNLPGWFQKEQMDERAEKSSAFLVLSQFGYWMSALGLQVEMVSETILQSCFRLRLDTERTCVLLAEIQSNQRSSPPPPALTPTQRSLKRCDKRLSLWSSWLPFALSAVYIPPSDYLSLILTSKTWSAATSRLLLQHLIDHSTETYRNSHRSNAWKYLLTAYAQTVEYEALLWKVNTTDALGKEIEEVIEMDVQRSYAAHPMISSNVLSNLLRTYAYYNPEIGYCQGMNYIAGHLFIQLQDESSAFKCLVGLIDQFSMHSLLIRQLPRLKLFFFQLDRLVGILLPDLHDVFREEMVSASHYAAPWFLTLFASVYQGGSRRMELLHRLWDRFLFKGWKVVFQTAIAVLQTLQSSLFHRKFEDIMSLLTSLSTQSLASGIYDPSFLETVSKVKVTTTLLRDLESEYEHLKLRAAVPPAIPQED